MLWFGRVWLGLLERGTLYLKQILKYLGMVGGGSKPPSPRKHNKIEAELTLTKKTLFVFVFCFVFSFATGSTYQSIYPSIYQAEK